jgi:hypothetical protein
MLTLEHQNSARATITELDNYLRLQLMKVINASVDFDVMRDCPTLFEGIRNLQSLSVAYDSSQREAMIELTEVVLQKINILIDALRELVALRSSGKGLDESTLLAKIHEKNNELYAAFFNSASNFLNRLSDGNDKLDYSKVWAVNNYHIFNTGVIGAIGSQASAFVTIDLGTLSKELGILKAQLRSLASNPQEELSVANVTLAENSSKMADSTSTYKYLKSAGKWSLDVATKIGTTVAAKAIEIAMLK